MGPKWKSIRCALCSEETGQGKQRLTRHLATHFEEISLSTLPPWLDSGSISAADETDTDRDDSEAGSEEAQSASEKPSVLSEHSLYPAEYDEVSLLCPLQEEEPATL